MAKLSKSQMWVLSVVQLMLLASTQVVNAQSQKKELSAVIGCAPQQHSLAKGFSVSYFHYPLTPQPGSPGCYSSGKTFQTTEYLHGGYETYGGGLIGSSSGVTDLTFSVPAAGKSGPNCLAVGTGNLPPNYNYKPQLTVTNFSMLITGYFLAPTTGSYDFIVNYVDDLTYVSIGAGKAFGCCQVGTTGSNPGQFDLIVNFGDTGKTTVDLLGGVYYPLRIFYVNTQKDSKLSVSFKGPDGIIHETFEDYVFMATDSEECTVPLVTTTSFWTTMATTTETNLAVVTGTDGVPTTEQIIVVKSPGVQAAKTEYTAWNGTYATTLTDIVTVTGSDGIPTM